MSTKKMMVFNSFTAAKRLQFWRVNDRTTVAFFCRQTFEDICLAIVWKCLQKEF